jgi:hypothetical protein
MGPMTGRGAGYCAGYGVPGYMNPGPGFGFGAGRGGFYGRGRGGGFGGGRGWRNRYWATGLPGWMRAGYPAWGAYGPYAGFAPYAPGGMSREHEIELLREQAEFLKESLEGVTKRIDELEAAAGEGEK